MKTLRVIYHLALADFHERSRRYSFLLTLAAIIFVGVLVNRGTLFLAIATTDASSALQEHRGELNAAWVGTMTVLWANTLLGLFGFYLVSDCIKRDIRTGVGQIIATTPVRRATYLVGKWLSNLAVLALLVAILAAAAAIMVLLNGEAALDLGALLMPFLAAALPYLALTAALAVVFETVPWLRGTAGNIVYVFLWFYVFYAAVKGTALPLLQDPVGIGVFRESLYAGAEAAFPNETAVMISIRTAIGGEQFTAFPWPGLTWTLGIVARQWLWAAVGLGLVLLSAPWFARFDPSREGLRRARAKPAEAKEGEPAAPRIKVPRIALPSLSPLVSRLAQASRFLGVLFAELRLLLKGRAWWWWLVILGLNIAMLSISVETVKRYLLPIAWLWPLAIWSEIGNRERKFNTYQTVFAAARPVLRQLPAAWVAGVSATALFGVAAAVAFLRSGDQSALAGWAGAAIFIPTLALALGVLSSGSRLFETVYLVWWYLGPYQKMPGLDFMAGPPQVYLLAAMGLLLLSAYWRGRQVRV